jgi:hypothetical protein
MRVHHWESDLRKLFGLDALEMVRSTNSSFLIGIIPIILSTSLMATFAYLSWPMWEQSFGSDMSPAAWLSSAQLLAAALLASRLVFEKALPSFFGHLLALALWILALDEQFMLHEQWKFGCQNWWSACAHLWVRELPTICVAFFGFAFLLKLLLLNRERSFRSLALGALTVGLFAIYIDLFQVPQMLSSLEEAFEVLAESLFLGALLIYRA